MEWAPAKQRQDFSLRFEMTAGEASRPSPYREQRDFSLRFEMTAGEASRPSPWREQRDFSLRFEMTAGYHQVLLPIGNTLRPNNLCRLALPPLSSRPTPAVISTFPLCHRDLPPLSSRPAPTVTATYPRCHLDRRERSQQGLESAPAKQKRDFSLRFEMTAGEASRPSPWREQRDFSLSLEMTRIKGNDRG